MRCENKDTWAVSQDEEGPAGRPAGWSQVRVSWQPWGEQASISKESVCWCDPGLAATPAVPPRGALVLTAAPRRRLAPVSFLGDTAGDTIVPNRKETP